MKSRRAVLLLAAVLFFWNLWGTDLWAPDEPYFGEGAREMVVDGQWAVPHVNGVVTTDKPPLFFWLIAIFSLPFGAVSSFTARLPSVLAGIGTIALTMRLGGRFGGGRVALWAGLLATTNYMLWEKARSSQIDALLTFLILVAVSAFEAYRAGDADGRRAGLLFWLAAGLGVLAKGPVGLLLPLGLALCTLGFERNLRLWRRFAPWTGPALFVAILAAWMVLATVGGHGEYSVWGAFREHALDRAVHGLHHKQPFWYYAKMLPVQLLPWTGLIPGAVLLAWRRWDGGDRLLLIWSAFIVAFFSVSTEKRDLYVLPAYPAFFLLAARLVDALTSAAGESAASAGGASRSQAQPAKYPVARFRWLQLPHAIFAFLVAFAGVALPFYTNREQVISTALAIAAGLPLALAGIGSGIAALQGRVARSLAILAAGASLCFVVLTSAVYPALNAMKSARPFAQAVRARTETYRAAGNTVLAYKLGNLPEALAFYTDGIYFPEANDEQALVAHIRDANVSFTLLDEDQLASLRPELRQRLQVIDTAKLARRTTHLTATPEAAAQLPRSDAPPR